MPTGPINLEEIQVSEDQPEAQPEDSDATHSDHLAADDNHDLDDGFFGQDISFEESNTELEPELDDAPVPDPAGVDVIAAPVDTDGGE